MRIGDACFFRITDAGGALHARFWRRTRIGCAGILAILVASQLGGAPLQSWSSPATGTELTLTVYLPERKTAPAGLLPTVVYVSGLSLPRMGTESDEVILSDFRRDGYLVVQMDYRGHARARPPFIHQDIAKLRADIQDKRALADLPLDPARIYLVPAGHRLRRDVVYLRSGERTWAMDIIYPSGPKQPVGTILEFSCDNTHRMGNSSLRYCTDTLLEGFASAGYAVAMADHPVPPPYKGINPMPDSAVKIKAAVRTLRAETKKLGLYGKIVSVGFSRGSSLSLMLVTTAGMSEFDVAGENLGTSSDVQGAVVLSGQFTFLDLLPNDDMAARYAALWGKLEKARDVWQRHGALDYLQSPPAFPLFLSINNAEGPGALHQMKLLRRRLAELGADESFWMERDGRGHRVPLNEGILEAMHAYVASRLR